MKKRTYHEYLTESLKQTCDELSRVALERHAKLYGLLVNNNLKKEQIMTREEFNEKYAWAYDAMRDGKKCRFWDIDKRNCGISVIVGLDYNDLNPFLCAKDGLGYQNCELIKTEKYIKGPAEAIRLLIENGYKFDENGDLHKIDDVLIHCGLFEHFGGKKEGFMFTWPDFLIEEREI